MSFRISQSFKPTILIKLRKRSALIIGLSTALLTACSSATTSTATSLTPSPQTAQAESPQTTQAEITVRIGTLKLIPMLQPFLLEDFLPDNYKVEVSTFLVGSEGRDALVAGSIDFYVIGHTFGLQSLAQGMPIGIVASVANGGAGVVVRADSPFKKLADLAGNKIGVARGTPQDVMIRSLLQSEGLSDQVDIEQVALPDMRAALKNGQVDAYVGAEPAVAADIVEGSGRLLISGDELYSTPIHDLNAALAVNSDFAAKSPEVVKNVVAAHKKITETLASDTDAWFEIAQKVTGIERPVFDAAAANIDLIWNIDSSYEKKAEDFANALKQYDYLEGDVDWSRYFLTEFLPKP